MAFGYQRHYLNQLSKWMKMECLIHSTSKIHLYKLINKL